MCVEVTLDQKDVYSLSKIINLTKYTKVIHYKLVIRREINGMLGRNKFDSLRIH